MTKTPNKVLKLPLLKDYRLRLPQLLDHFKIISVVFSSLATLQLLISN